MIVFRFAIQDLVHDWGRSLLTIGTLAAIVLAYLILTALNQALQFYDSENRGPFTNLMVLSSDVLDPMESSLSADVVQAVSEVGGSDVQRVAPMIFRRMRIENTVMQVRAGTREDMEIVNRLSLLQGKWPQNDDELVASEGAIQTTHWSLGRDIKVYGSDFHLVGIVSAYGTRFSSLWMTLHAAEKLFGAGRGYQVIFLQLKPGSDVQALLAAVEARVKQLGRYSAYLEDQVSDSYYKTYGSLRRLSLVEDLIALLAMTFGTYNATSLTLGERSRELSILRVVGFSTATLRAFLFIRALLQTLLAYLIGLSLALLFVQNRQALNPILIQAQSMPLSLTAWNVTTGIALVVCFSALGVWLPTQSYFRISVADQARG